MGSSPSTFAPISSAPSISTKVITTPVDLWTTLRVAHRVHRNNSNSKPPPGDGKCVHHVSEHPSTLSPVQTGEVWEGGRAAVFRFLLHQTNDRPNARCPAVGATPHPIPPPP